MSKFKYNKDGKLERATVTTKTTATKMQLMLYLESLGELKNIKPLTPVDQIYFDHSVVFSADNPTLIPIASITGKSITEILDGAAAFVT